MAEQLGLQVKWTRVKFAALIPSLQAGQCDMIVSELFIKPNRQKVIDFVPFSVSGEQIVVRKGDAQDITSIDDLAGKKVAVSNGTTFMELLQEENKQREAAGKEQVRILIVPGVQETFHQLMAGMVDAAGVTTTAAAYYIPKAEGRLARAGDPFHEITDGFGISKDKPKLRQAMQAALQALRDSGQYQKIFAKYDFESVMLDN